MHKLCSDFMLNVSLMLQMVEKLINRHSCNYSIVIYLVFNVTIIIVNSEEIISNQLATVWA